MTFKWFTAVFIFVFCFAQCFNTSVQGQEYQLLKSSSNKTITDELLRKVLEVFRTLVSPDQQFNDLNLNYIDDWVNLTSALETVIVHDLTSFDIVEAHANTSTLHYTIKIAFSKLKIWGQYDMNIACELINLFGSGPFRIDASGVNLDLVIILYYKGEKLYLKDIPIDFGLDQIHLRFDGIGGGGAASDAVNDLINDVAMDVIAKVKPTVLEKVENYVKSLLSFLINGNTMDQLVDFINALIGG